MSLDFNYSRMADKSVLFTSDGKEFNNLCQTACFTLMAIGVNGVSEDNLDEIVLRCKALTYLDGWSHLNRDEWVKLIGLTTNVSDESRRKWFARMAKPMKLSGAALLTKVAAA